MEGGLGGGAKTSCGTCGVYSQGRKLHLEQLLEGGGGRGRREECEGRVHHSLKDPGR